MRKKSLAVVLAALCVTAGGLRAQVARDTISAGEIVRRYVEARGGLDRIRAIRTLVLEGPRRPNGNPGRRMIRARPFYMSVGSEGNDGTTWEGPDAIGTVMRTTHAAGAATRHAAYFDDPLILSLEPGWTIELTGSEPIAGRDAYRLRVVFPDGWVNEVFVDKESWLLTARRWTAPFHALGDAVTTETHFSEYRPVEGVLFPTRVTEYDLATGEVLGDGRWASVEANVPLSPSDFAPPPAPDTPLSRLVNAIFKARFLPGDALVWYHDFRANPETADIDAQAAIRTVAYQCLKNGGVETAKELLEELVAEHPESVRAQFGLGRAYRAAGREDDAVARFREALRLDPDFEPAKQALRSRVEPY